MPAVKNSCVFWTRCVAVAERERPQPWDDDRLSSLPQSPFELTFRAERVNSAVVLNEL
jgi:hypothetical protein